MSNELLIDPKNPFCFGASNRKMYHLLVFSAMVAGKSAMPTAHKLTELMTRFPELDYAGLWENQCDPDQIDRALRIVRTGKYRLLGAFFTALQDRVAIQDPFGTIASRDHRDSLVELPGIGFKSASMYLLYTDPKAVVAALDVHILKYMKSLGYDVPAASPQSERQYMRIESLFLAQAVRLNVRPWVLDIFLWRQYNGKQAWDQAKFTAFVNTLETDPTYSDIVR